MTELLAPKIYTLTPFADREPFLDTDIKALDVGCGSRKLPGATGMDVLKLPTVDIVHNVDVLPWPI
ncbi:hypothetical protein ACSTKR_23565, partial [Vibrio parahaemolyticus]